MVKITIGYIKQRSLKQKKFLGLSIEVRYQVIGLRTMLNSTLQVKYIHYFSAYCHPTKAVFFSALHSCLTAIAASHTK